MKKAIFLLLLPIIWISCSKNGDDDADGGNKTMVTITNNVGNSVSGIVVGSWTGGPAKLIKSIGTLNNGEKSIEIEVTDKSLVNVYIYFDANNKTYMFSNGFGIGHGITNNLYITAGLPTLPLEKTDEMYPK